MEKNKRIKLAIRLLIAGFPESDQTDIIESVRRDLTTCRIKRLEKLKNEQITLEDELRGMPV